MALHQWGGGGTRDKKVSCTINPDGSVELKSRDPGHRHRRPDDPGDHRRRGPRAQADRHHLEYRQLDVPARPGFGRLDHDAVDGPAALDAVTKARDALFKKIAPAVKAEPGDLSLKGGQLWVAGEPVMSWKDACRKLGMASISETGSIHQRQKGSPAPASAAASSPRSPSTSRPAMVKVKKIVAIQDSGLIIDKLTWESQVYGGVIGGLNYGLFEERLVDPTTGTMLNPDMEMYKLAGAADIPEIIVRAYEPPEQKARGVIGVGEPPTISTAAAIGNAVTNAIGVRVPEWPMTPRNVLNALATASKEGKA